MYRGPEHGVLMEYKRRKYEFNSHGNRTDREK